MKDGPAPQGNRVIKRAVDALMIVACAATVLMAVQVCLDIALRYFFRIALHGTLEIASGYYMVAISFLPIAYLQFRNEHLSVDALVNLLPARLAAAIELVSWTICLAVFSVFCWAGVKKALEKTHALATIDTPAYSIPIWPSYWMVPVGLACAALVALAQILTVAVRLGAGRASGGAEDLR